MCQEVLSTSDHLREEVSVIGTDLAKRSFQLHVARADGSVEYRKKLSRGRVLDCSLVVSRIPLLLCEMIAHDPLPVIDT